MASMTIESTALVSTDRPGRYGKQLASHLGRRLQSSWDAEVERGQVTFGGEEFSGGLVGELTLTAEEGALRLQLTTGDQHVGQLEGVVGRHLVGFGKKDELTVFFQRSDGTAGTSYTAADALSGKPREEH
jgi:uncharacterized protein